LEVSLLQVIWSHPPAFIISRLQWEQKMMGKWRPTKY